MKYVQTVKIVRLKILAEFYICWKSFGYLNTMKIVHSYKMRKKIHMIMKGSLMRCAYMKNSGFWFPIKTKKLILSPRSSYGES